MRLAAVKVDELCERTTEEGQERVSCVRASSARRGDSGAITRRPRQTVTYGADLISVLGPVGVAERRDEEDELGLFVRKWSALLCELRVGGALTRTMVSKLVEGALGVLACGGGACWPRPFWLVGVWADGAWLAGRPAEPAAQRPGGGPTEESSAATEVHRAADGREAGGERDGNAARTTNADASEQQATEMNQSQACERDQLDSSASVWTRIGLAASARFPNPSKPRL